jgi:hypothetical protein
MTDRQRDTINLQFNDDVGAEVNSFVLAEWLGGFHDAHHLVLARVNKLPSTTDSTKHHSRSVSGLSCFSV